MTRFMTRVESCVMAALLLGNCGVTHAAEPRSATFPQAGLRPDASPSVRPELVDGERRGRLRHPVHLAGSRDGGASGAEPRPSALRAGFAEEEITPDLSPGAAPVWLGGYGRGRRATGVNDPLKARAAVLESGGTRIAIVTLDLVGLFLDQVEAIRRSLDAGAPSERVDHCLVFASHTHASGDTIGLWGPGLDASGVDPEYLGLVKARAVRAVRSAVSRLTPVRLRLGTTLTEGLSRDSRLPRLLDERLFAIEAVDGSGRVVFTLVNWSAHPTALDGRNTRVSADYVGYLVARLAVLRAGPALFVNGSIGGQISVAEPDRDGRPAAPRTFAQARRVGEAVAEAAHRALGKAVWLSVPPFEAVTRTAWVPLANPLYRAGIAAGVVPRQLYAGGRPAPAVGLAGTGTHIRTEVGRLSLGGFQAALVPGELYPELLEAAGLDRVEPEADFPDAPPEPPLLPMLDAEHRAVFGLANDLIGYIIPKSRWDRLPPYAYGRDRPQYGETNSCGPDTAPALLEAFRELLRREE